MCYPTNNPDEPPRNLRTLLRPIIEQCEESTLVVAHLLGPFHRDGRTYALPRFLRLNETAMNGALATSSCGASTIAIYSGFDGRDGRITQCCLEFLQDAIFGTPVADAACLAFYPLCNPSGWVNSLAITPDRVDLLNSPWTMRGVPELYLLEFELRFGGYKGLVFIDTVAESKATLEISDNTLLESDLLVHLQSICTDQDPTEALEICAMKQTAGCVAVFDDLPEYPWLLRLRLPEAWSYDKLRLWVSRFLHKLEISHNRLLNYPHTSVA
ncbi:MAG: hypothetical protein SFY80_00035 [Verrucomicrobiota bacterium]|nr:hypothetical protein [Verrucomicrobiota bacterium]